MLRPLRCLRFKFTALAPHALAAFEGPDVLSRIVAQLDSLHRVTDAPHRMADSTASRCRPAFNTNLHEGSPFGLAYCHVNVAAEANHAMTSGEDHYPVGAVIVKAKLESKESRDPVLYTVMRKMQEGYDAEHGDWEHAVLDAANKRVL